jgi:hypothetical protein
MQARATRDPAFRQVQFQEAAQVLFDGDVASGRSALQDDINATIGFDTLAEATNTPAKSLMRIVGQREPDGCQPVRRDQGPSGPNGVHLEVRAVS